MFQRKPPKLVLVTAAEFLEKQRVQLIILGVLIALAVACGVLVTLLWIFDL